MINLSEHPAKKFLSHSAIFLLHLVSWAMYARKMHKFMQINSTLAKFHGNTKFKIFIQSSFVLEYNSYIKMMMNI